jgi:hypothetical protein
MSFHDIFKLGFKSTECLRLKIVINNQITEDVNSFYLGCIVSYIKTMDAETKLHKFQQLLETTEQTICLLRKTRLQS